jgi:xanthine dehydrogenase accessory factor
MKERHVIGSRGTEVDGGPAGGAASSVSGLPRDWVASLLRVLALEPEVVRIVVAEVRGSAPREAGAFMLVGREGVEGSIGGGRLEWEAIAAARVLLRKGDGPRAEAHTPVGSSLYADSGTAIAAPAQVQKVVLAADVGQCCGGVVLLWLERFTREDLDLLQAATTAGVHGPAVLTTCVRGSFIQRRLVRRQGAGDTADRLLREPRQRAQPRLLRGTEGEVTFLERLDDDLPAVWLYGAGHVGQALARILTELPLRFTWIDSRAEMFPKTIAEGVRILQDPDTAATVSEAPVGAYFLVMSHSHPLDYALCHALLERNDFAWLGLIGSESKAARFRSRLTRAGLGADVIAKLVCPIGIGGINSKWPAAIAVSVAAQLLQQISASAERPELLRRATELLPAPQVHRDCSAESCATCGTPAAQSRAVQGYDDGRSMQPATAPPPEVTS